MPLMTGKSVPHPHGRLAAGEEIVRARRKRRDHANPLVLGSNPSGPTINPEFPRIHCPRKPGKSRSLARLRFGRTQGNLATERAKQDFTARQHRPLVPWSGIASRPPVPLELRRGWQPCGASWQPESSVRARRPLPWAEHGAGDAACLLPPATPVALDSASTEQGRTTYPDKLLFVRRSCGSRSKSSNGGFHDYGQDLYADCALVGDAPRGDRAICRGSNFDGLSTRSERAAGGDCQQG